MKVNSSIQVGALSDKLGRFFDLAGAKIRDIDATWDPGVGTPVFTVDGKYTTRGWTEWTQGFQFGCAILQFEASGENEFLSMF